MVHLILHFCFLTGVAAVRVVQIPPSLVLQEGQTASMSCSVEGRQNVNILHYYWKKTGAQNSTKLQDSSIVTITSNLQSSSLLIPSVTARDSGLYVCDTMIDNTSLLYTYTGNGSHLLVTVTPVISLWIEEAKELLICEAQRFYPQNLTISWSFSLMETQTWDNFTENEDSTYTKRSTVKITEGLWGQSVICSLGHRSLTAKLSKSLSLYEFSHYYYNVLLIVPLFIVAFIFWKRRFSKKGSMSGTAEPSTITKERGSPSMQDQDSDVNLHYAAIFPANKGAVRKTPQQRMMVREEESTEYAAVKTAKPVVHHTPTADQNNVEEPYVFYASLRMSPP
ncbi:uncharacterized protein LOC134573703 [Pelobates fuscus]|uniref:uncharacterized protein LOC134573703 n=1 Tax=Pelobates fuscus TaxID=191477 RepID=UPI002FE432C3